MCFKDHLRLRLRVCGVSVRLQHTANGGGAPAAEMERRERQVEVVHAWVRAFVTHHGDVDVTDVTEERFLLAAVVAGCDGFDAHWSASVPLSVGVGTGVE